MIKHQQLVISIPITRVPSSLKIYSNEKIETNPEVFKQSEDEQYPKIIFTGW